MPKPSVILASASVGRKLLLTKLGVPFSVITSTIDEDTITDPDSYQMLIKRARAKAEDVASKLTVSSSRLTVNSESKKIVSSANREPPTTNYLIIAADSMAILDNRTFGKAKTKALGKQLLRDLMGNTHDFATATCIIHASYSVIPAQAGIHLLNPHKLKLNVNNYSESLTHTQVTLRHLPEPELDEYASRFDFTRFAAGYALNETPWDLVTKIDGSYTNVIGLPFEVILPILRSFEII